MVEIDVGVACGVDEVAGAQAAHLCHHHAQEGIGSNIEGNSQKDIGRTLIELEGESAISHIELHEGMTWGQMHLWEIGHVPCRNDDAPAVGIMFQVIHSLLYLVDMSTRIVGPGTPLVSIDMTQVTCLGVGPLVPDTHAMLLEVTHIGVTLQEPEKFVDDGLEMNLLGGEQRKALLKVITALMTKNADGTCTCAVMLLHALIKYLLHQIKILSHNIGIALRWLYKHVLRNENNAAMGA